MGNIPVSCCQENPPKRRPVQIAPIPTGNCLGTESPRQIYSNTQMESSAKTPSKPHNNTPTPYPRGPENYQYKKYLGQGFFGRVVLAQQKQSHRLFAMKIIEKNKIKQFNVLQCELIRQIGHLDFLVSIKQTFQNKQNIYIVMEYLPMGDLYFYLRKKQVIFTEDNIRNIMAEIVAGIALLHSHSIIYRELKPQNLLITEQGHIKLTDYGLSKVIVENTESVFTCVGTLEYMAPEALKGQFGQKADIWSLGMLMFELMFKDNLFQNQERKPIPSQEADYTLEKSFIESKINSKIGYMSLDFRDLLLRLLQKDPNERISLQEMRSHDFFCQIDWKSVQSHQNEPPLRQLVQKHDYIKFRDATTQKYIRRQVNRFKNMKENYQMTLYEFRNSQ